MNGHDLLPLFFFTPDSPNSTQVPVVNSTKYLGITVNNKGTLKSHLGPKLAYVRKQFNTLQRLWSHGNIDTQFKIKIYKGIFPPMAMYCLQHDWHLDQTLKKIDAWHYRLVRRACLLYTSDAADE